MSGSPRRLLERVWPILLPCLLVVLVSVVVAPLSEVLERTVLVALVNLVLVVALFQFTGLSGVFSFGHVAFMAIGAYTAGVLTVDPFTKPFLLPDLPGVLADAHVDPAVAPFMGGLVAACVAALLAIPLMRLAGISASLVTLGVLLIVYTVAREWIAITNGTAGLSGIPTSLNVGTALAWALGAMVVAYLFQQSRVGLRLRASREDEIAASALGVHVARERGLAFVTSAFFAGAAGGLYAALIGSLTPGAFFLSLTFLTIVMLVVGGVTSLAGAVVGTIFISALSEILRRIEKGVDFGLFEFGGRAGLREVVLGLVMIVVLILRPKGITGGREITWPFGRQRAGGPASTAPPLVDRPGGPAIAEKGAVR
jgi:branched-chain amino acid transport system permease protein